MGSQRSESGSATALFGDGNIPDWVIEKTLNTYDEPSDEI